MIAAYVPLICCIVFALLHLLVGNKAPASPTTTKLVAMFFWFCMLSFLVVMLSASHEMWRLGR